MQSIKIKSIQNNSCNLCQYARLYASAANALPLTTLLGYPTDGAWLAKLGLMG